MLELDFEEIDVLELALGELLKNKEEKFDMQDLKVASDLLSQVDNIKRKMYKNLEEAKKILFESEVK